MNLALLSILLLKSFAPQDGALLFLERSNKVVEAYTGKEITHVGVIMNDDGEPWLYEATPGKVRRLRLEKYYEEVGEFNRGRKTKARVLVLQPLTPFTAEQVEKMRAHLDSQIARRYSIRNYVRRKPGDGVHCAELTAATLNSSGAFELADGSHTSPGLLFERIVGYYAPPVEIPAIAPVDGRSWCERSSQWWAGCFQWCRWCCYESWAFCW